MVKLISIHAVRCSHCRNPIALEGLLTVDALGHAGTRPKGGSAHHEASMTLLHPHMLYLDVMPVFEL